ncbi:Paf1 complex component [Coemansia sp. IMI 203386]|nr:Paf1 complex component [Coemansia sp. IMI 203386]
MSDLFGSDVSDSEAPARELSQPGTPQPTAAATKSGTRNEQQRNGSATPEPTRYSDNEDDLFGSDNEQDKVPAYSKTRGAASGGDALDDLFDSDEEEDVGRRRRRIARRKGRSDDEDDADSVQSDRGGVDDERMDQDEDDDDDDRDSVSKVQVRVMSARVPVLSVPRSHNGKYILARTPNLLQLDPTPFSTDSYEDIIEQEHMVTRKHGIKSAVTTELASAVEGIIANTIRWRNVAGEDGKLKRESNARLVRWSDGSTTVVVGGNNPESYSITEESLTTTPKGEQHYYAAAHHPRELLMQNHARLTDQWLFRPSMQSASGRLAVSLLLGRVRAKALGESARGADAKGGRMGAKSSRTRFVMVDKDPELIAKRAEEEEEKKERQRRKEERLRERREAKELQYGRDAGPRSGRHGGGDYYSDEERDYSYASGADAGAAMGDDDELDVVGAAPSYGRSRPIKREHGRFGPAASAPRKVRDSYIEEEDDDFIVDDDEELEVGSRDDFDDEEDELAAQRLNSAKRAKYSDDEGDSGQRRDGGGAGGRGSKPRRVMVSDDEDEDEDL